MRVVKRYLGVKKPFRRPVESRVEENSLSEDEALEALVQPPPVEAEAIGDDLENEDGCDSEDSDNPGEAAEASEIEKALVVAERIGEANAEGKSDSDSGDDIWNDEIIPDPLLSDDEEDARRERIQWDEGDNFTLGQTFNSASDFKRALLRYSLKTGYDIRLYLSNQDKIGAICSDTCVSCPWRIYCSYERRRHKMQVKVYIDEHICVRSGYTKLLKRSTIAQLFEERLRVDPSVTALEMAVEIKRTYNLIVTEDQCRKAKTKLFRQRQATHEGHFARIWDYEAELKRSTAGTTVEIETIPGPTPGSIQRFDRMYICFTSQRESWMKTCRPIIGIDGAFLKWDIKGHLLAAVGRDGDNRIVPIAWAVVEVENDSNWDWFIRHLGHDLSLGEGSKVTVISYRQKGLVKAVQVVLPHAEHRMCARHVLGNWKRDSHDMELERLFWKIARSYTKGEYEDNIDALSRYNPGAFDSLKRTNPTTWSRAFFRLGSCCNDNLNNLSESFNKTICESRRKPLLDMLEDIRRQCMVRNAKRAVISNRWKNRYTRRAHAEIENAKNQSKDCIRFTATGNRHEVEYHGDSYTVYMNEKTCGCMKWQLIGIPCSHAMCVIMAKKETVDAYVSDYYKTSVWQQTYSWGIALVQGMKLWPRLNRFPVLPPPLCANPRGRPSKYARKRGASESSSSSSKTRLSREKRIMTCSNCKEEGHNKLGCSNPSVVYDQAKKPRGRPRKNHGQPTQASQGSQPTQASQGSQPTQPSHGSQPTQAGHGSQPTQPSHGSQPTQAAHGSQPMQASHGSQPLFQM